MRVWTPLPFHTERDVHGLSWKFSLTSDDIDPRIVNALGITVMETREVLIWAGQPLREMADTIVHETAHVHLWASQKRVCETSIGVVIPQLMDSIRRRGWTMPTLPDGWRGLAQHARHVRASGR